MKKLIFLLLALMVGVGMVTAGPVHPPGAEALEMVLSGYGVYEAAVTPDTVLEADPIMIELPASFWAVPVIDDNAGLPQWDVLIKPIIASKQTGFYLRC